MHTHEGIPVPPVVMAVSVLSQRLTPQGKKAKRLRRVAAVALGAGSGILLLSTVGTYARRGTSLDPTVPSSASVLLTSGTNALSRNPIYLGLAGLLVALAVDRGSWRAMLPVAGFVAAMDHFQIAREEVALRSLFGEDYLQYCSRTPRWLDARSVKVLEAAFRQ